MNTTDFDFAAARDALTNLRAALAAFEPIAKNIDDGAVSARMVEVATSNVQSLGASLMFKTELADAISRIEFMCSGLGMELQVEELAPPHHAVAS